MSTPAEHLITHHSRSWQQNRYVYPVISRRSRGLSIGVNLNPDKVCNFDCIYCCVDRTILPGKVEVDPELLRRELTVMLRLAQTGLLYEDPPFDQTPPELRRLNDIAFSGDGEPTSFAQFPEVCRIVTHLMKQLGVREDVKVILITNATLLHLSRVRQGLKVLAESNSEIWAKLDAGTEEYYRLIDRSSVPLQRILDNILLIGRDRPVVIQSLFMKVHQSPPPPEEIEAYVRRLHDLLCAGCRIDRVQVYTVARRPAESFVSPLDEPLLNQISRRIQELGLVVETYPAP